MMNHLGSILGQPGNPHPDTLEVVENPENGFIGLHHIRYQGTTDSGYPRSASIGVLWISPQAAETLSDVLAGALAGQRTRNQV